MVPSRSVLPLALTLCVVALIAGGGTAAASPVALDDPPDNETVGDVVELAASVPENGTATGTVASTGDDAYSRTVRLSDGSGDGRITLRINTFLGKRVAEEREVYTTTDGDEVTVEKTIGARIRADDYEIRLYNGTETSGRPADSTVVELAAPTHGNVSYEVAPANASDRLDTREDIQRGRDAGWVTNRSEVAANDTLLVELRVDGLSGALAASSGTNDTERFVSLLDRRNTSFRLEKDESLMRGPISIRLNRPSLSNIVTVPQEDTYYVVVDTAEAGLTPTTWSRVEDGDEFEPHLVVGGESRLRAEHHSHSQYYDAIRFVDREAEFETDGDSVAVTQDRNLTVKGRTNLAPGTSVRVTLSSGATTRSRTTTVLAPHQFNVTFDVEGDSLGENAMMTVSSDGTVFQTKTVPDSVVEAPSALPANADRVPVSVSELRRGGYVYAVGPDGESVGRSGYIQPKEAQNVSVPIATANLSANETLTVVAAEGHENWAEGSYPIDGLLRWETVELRAPSQPSDDSRVTPTPDGREPSNVTDGEPPTSAAGPGFGVLAALCAVLFAVLAASGRRRP